MLVHGNPKTVPLTRLSCIYKVQVRPQRRATIKQIGILFMQFLCVCVVKERGRLCSTVCLCVCNCIPSLWTGLAFVNTTQSRLWDCFGVTIYPQHSPTFILKIFSLEDKVDTLDTSSKLYHQNRQISLEAWFHSLLHHIYNKTARKNWVCQVCSRMTLFCQK